MPKAKRRTRAIKTRRRLTPRRATRHPVRAARRPRTTARPSRPQRQAVADIAPAPPSRPLFSKRELQVFRRLLVAQRVNLAGGIQQIAKGASKSQRETSGDLSTYTYHMADVASDTYDRELSLNIASSEQRVLYQIEEAIKRTEDGSYGRCLDCNKPIPQTRLRAVPYAALCIGCQRQREDRRNR